MGLPVVLIGYTREKYLMKNRITTTSGLEWNTMLGLTQRLKQDQQYRDYLLILCGCYFGLRIGDLLSLRWIDVIEKTELNLVEQKTGKKRSITINDKVQSAITFCYSNYDTVTVDRERQFIFSNRWGGRLTVSYINKRLKVIFRKYKILTQNASSHTLRKTFGKYIWEQNDRSENALVFLSEIFSHASIGTTRKYIGITQKQIADIYLAM